LSLVVGNAALLGSWRVTHCGYKWTNQKPPLLAVTSSTAIDASHFSRMYDSASPVS